MLMPLLNLRGLRFLKSIALVLLGIRPEQTRFHEDKIKRNIMKRIVLIITLFSCLVEAAQKRHWSSNNWSHLSVRPKWRDNDTYWAQTYHWRNDLYHRLLDSAQQRWSKLPNHAVSNFIGASNQNTGRHYCYWWIWFAKLLPFENYLTLWLLAELLSCISSALIRYVV